MGGHNNQLKSSRNVGVNYGETACRAMTIGEDAIESFRPSEFGPKNKYNKIRRGFRQPPIDDCTQQPTKFTLDRWEDDRRGRVTVEERRGSGIRSFWGRSSWEGGEYKIK